MKLPHYLRVSRALALVSTIAAPATIACGGRVNCPSGAEDDQGHCASGMAAEEDATPGEQSGGIFGYDAAPGIDAGIVVYDAGPGPCPDASCGIQPFDSGLPVGDFVDAAPDAGEPDAIITGSLPWTDAGDKG
jgi:hypothetical protein